jgi:hypothetical protein
MVNGRIAGFPKRGRSPTVAPLQMATELLRHNCSTVERPLAASGGEAGIRSPLTKENLHASSINLAGATTRDGVGFSAAEIGSRTDG